MIIVTQLKIARNIHVMHVYNVKKNIVFMVNVMMKDALNVENAMKIVYTMKGINALDVNVGMELIKLIILNAIK